MRLPRISERTGERIGIALAIVTAPVTIPMVACIAALCGLVLAKPTHQPDLGSASSA